MDRPRYKRQLFFFLLAVLLPSTALVLFGVGFLTQERELSENREAEGRASFARDTGRRLEDRLKEIASEATQERQDGADQLHFPGGHGVLWLGTFDGTEFHSAWSFLESPPPIAREGLDGVLKQAERLEFRDRNFVAATERYLLLADRAQDPRYKTLALQWAARSLMKAEDTDGAIRHALRVLSSDSSLRDEEGIPLAYYAADLLLSTGVDSVRSVVIARLIAETTDPRWFLPARTYMLRDMIRASGDSAATTAATTSSVETEYVEGLIEDIPGLMRAGVTDRWLPYGDRLVGTGPPGPAGQRDFYAVTPDELVQLAPDDGRVLTIQFEGEHSEQALSLRPYLRDAYVTLSQPEGSTASFSRGFFLLGLILLVGLTLFGGYLLWRDVRRESRLAQLRAQFVSSVSHELRTPLTSIRMFAETMMIDEETPVEDRRRYLGVIANESERLTRMLNNVLSASSIEQGTSSYHMATSDLRDPVGAAIEAMRYAFEQEGVQLETTLPDVPVVVMIDVDAVEQAVLNLLSNALKYGAGSPVTLELRTDRKAGIDIFVGDQGPGIDPADTVLIFDRFYRSEKPENQRVTGAGLGLSLVKHIVEAHGGSASVQSTVGDGSTFRLHLPFSS